MTRALVLILLVAVGCRSELDGFATGGDPDDEPDEEPGVDPDQPDILVVVLDTTSPWTVEAAMPNAAAFLEAGRSWELAVSPSNSTIDGVAGLIQGRFTKTSDLQPDAESTAEVTLAERLQAAGYSTVFASGNESLDLPLFSLGYDRTWIHGRDAGSLGADQDAVEFFVDGWAELPSPRFGWLQLNAGHDYSGAPDSFDFPPIAPDEAERAWGWYVDDAAETDALLPQVFDLLPAGEGLTLLTADHGELFWDRGSFMVGKEDSFGHGLANAPMEIEVPFGLQGAGVQAASLAGPLNTMELFETVLSAAGLGGGTDLRTEDSERLAGSALCNLLDLRLTEGGGTMSALVLPDGRQRVRTHYPGALPAEDAPPLLVEWMPSGVGLQADWQELSVADLSVEETAFLFNTALPECRGFADLCDEYPELAAIGYIDCD